MVILELLVAVSKREGGRRAGIWGLGRRTPKAILSPNDKSGIEITSKSSCLTNVYIDTSAYKVKRYPVQLREYMKGHGRKKVLFGSNFPMVSPADCLAGLDELGLDDEARRLSLGANAARVFKLV